MSAALIALALTMAPHSPLGDLIYCSHEVVFGVPQSGKTWLGKRRVASAGRVVYVSPTPDYDDCGEVVSAEDFERDARLLLGGVTARVVVRIGLFEGSDVAAEFASAVATCRRFGRETKRQQIILGDEVGDYSLRAAECLTRLHRNGHHDGCASVLISQCAVDVPLTCRRTATRVTSLLQTRSEDLTALARDYGEPFAEAARTWRPGMAPAVWTLPTLYRR